MTKRRRQGYDDWMGLSSKTFAATETLRDTITRVTNEELKFRMPFNRGAYPDLYKAINLLFDDRGTFK